MTANKYGNMLTIILIVLIVAILIGAGLLVYNYVIKPNVEDDRTIEAIEEFDRNTGNEEEQEPVQDDEEMILRQLHLINLQVVQVQETRKLITTDLL